MIYADVKKLGRMPNGGGHRIHGRVQGEANPRARNLAGGRPKDRGYAFLHRAGNDHSQFVYSEILTDETKETASAFITNASRCSPPGASRSSGVLIDNGSWYRSALLSLIPAEAGIRLKRTRPCRPQTKGKVERNKRILQKEWAYAMAYNSEAQR